PRAFYGACGKDEVVCNDAQRIAVEVLGCDASQPTSVAVEREIADRRSQPDVQIFQILQLLCQQGGYVAVSVVRTLGPAPGDVFFVPGEKTVRINSGGTGIVIRAIVDLKDRLDLALIVVEHLGIDRPGRLRDVRARAQFVCAYRDHPAAPGRRTAAKAAETTVQGARVAARRVIDLVQFMDVRVKGGIAAVDQDHPSATFGDSAGNK